MEELLLAFVIFIPLLMDYAKVRRANRVLTAKEKWYIKQIEHYQKIENHGKETKGETGTEAKT